MQVVGHRHRVRVPIGILSRLGHHCRQVLGLSCKRLGGKTRAAQCQRQSVGGFGQLTADLRAVTECFVKQATQLTKGDADFRYLDLDLLRQRVDDRALCDAGACRLAQAIS